MAANHPSNPPFCKAMISEEHTNVSFKYCIVFEKGNLPGKLHQSHIYILVKVPLSEQPIWIHLKQPN